MRPAVVGDHQADSRSQGAFAEEHVRRGHLLFDSHKWQQIMICVVSLESWLHQNKWLRPVRRRAQQLCGRVMHRVRCLGGVHHVTQLSSDASSLQSERLYLLFECFGFAVFSHQLLCEMN